MYRSGCTSCHGLSTWGRFYSVDLALPRMSKSEQTHSQEVSQASTEHREGAVKSTSPRRWTSWDAWRAWGRLVSRRLRWWSTSRLILSGLVALVFVGSLWIIARELRGFDYAEVWAYLTDLPASYVLVAMLLTALTFVVLAGYDALALRYVGVRLSGERIALSAFIGYAVSQAIGNPILTGGSVRFRLYSLWGLSAADVAKAILFAGVSFWLGFFTLGAGLFLAEPITLAETLELPVSSTVVGLACLLPPVVYLGLTVFRSTPLRAWGWTLDIPPRWMFPIQVALAAGDLFLASSVLYVLLPPDVALSLPHLQAVYLTALLAGLVSHVPGGLGVFESIMLLLLTPPVSAPTMLGALLAYRGIFHLLPLVIAMLTFAGYELWQGMSVGE